MVRGMKDDGGFIGNTFTTITISGVDENIPKRELDRILDQMLRERVVLLLALFYT